MLMILLTVRPAWSQTSAIPNLGISVRSVATYDTCELSPLNDAEMRTASFTDQDVPEGEQPPGVTPCQQVGNTSVTVIRLNLNVNRVAGTENLVFTLNNLVTPEQASNYDPSVICSGVPTGQQCRLLQDIMTVTFETTQLAAAYDLQPRASTVPYGVFAVYSDNKLLNSSYGSALAYTNTIPCPSSEDWYDSYKPMNSPASYANAAGLSGVCPVSLGKPDQEQYYSPPTPSTADGKCTYLYCRRKKSVKDASKNPWRSVTMIPVEPSCTVFDIQERPRALMNVRITFKNRAFNRSMVASTLFGGSVQAIPGLAYARILRPNLGTGLVGDNMPGAIVTCFTAPLGDSNILNVPGAVNDYPVNDGFSIKNPWTAVNGIDSKGLDGCVLPAAKCRQKITGRPETALWYYVDPRNLVRGFGGTCNTNGASAAIYTDPGTAAQVCANVEKNPETCVPGFQQVISDQFTYTPCEVSQRQADLIAQFRQSGTTNGWNFVTPNFNPYQPPCAMRYPHLICDTLSGNSNLVGLDMVLYVTGSLLGTVSTVSSARFVNASCGGLDGGSGAVPFVLLNTGNLPGSFRVRATFKIASPQVTSVNPAVGETNVDVPATRTAQSAIDFSYTGDLGTKVLSVTMDLFERVTGSRLETIDVPCSIIQGIKAVNPDGSSDNNRDPSSDDNKKCLWYRLNCWHNLSFWGFVWRIFLSIIVFGSILAAVIGVTYGFVTSSVSYFDSQHSFNLEKKRIELVKQQKEQQKRERQELLRERTEMRNEAERIPSPR